jgi:hypothetical protein
VPIFLIDNIVESCYNINIRTEKGPDMSKQYVINSKNFANNIKLSRDATIISNVNEDNEAWIFLEKYPCNEFLKLEDVCPADILKNKKKEFINLVNQIGKKITEHIYNDYSDVFNVDSVHNVTRGMISQVAKMYYSLPSGFELLKRKVCRNPSRQQIDEDVEYQTLKKYLQDHCTVTKHAPNAKTTESLYQGKLYTKLELKTNGIKIQKNESRSIDFTIKGKNYTYKICAKYTRDSEQINLEGSGQGHQVGEALTYAQNAETYVSLNNNNIKFVVLLDGLYESKIPAMNEAIVNKDRVFVSNGEELINRVISEN